MYKYIIIFFVITSLITIAAPDVFINAIKHLSAFYRDLGFGNLEDLSRYLNHLKRQLGL